ncbi:MAG: hypothetical protein JF609_08510 [Verrucomicrobia bacterium]|nr:hypothetical protein [Verrucomicrobiota bacterium]
MTPSGQLGAPNQLSGTGANRDFYLQRLPREYYQADAVVHWTMPVAMRGTGWLTDAFHAGFREVMLHAAAREGVFCPTYCLMPDHIHLVWMGMRRDTDQKNGMKFLREHLGLKLRPHQFQHQAHDHVLRAEQRKRNAFAKVCFYIIDNARKEGLVQHPSEWRFCGAIIPGYPAMHPLENDYWPKFWKIYHENLAADAGKIIRPPF